MTDRELLELAAKAADIEIDWDGEYALTVQLFRGHLKNWLPWNPLTDDGDALRLAVKLDIEFRWHSVLNQALANAPRQAEVVVNGEDCRQDRYAATRRAIVRAAAIAQGDKA